MAGADDITVSPEEMSALMETIQETTTGRTRELTDDGGLMDVVRYDLVAARTVGRGQLPTLDLVNERFAALIGDTLGRMTGETTRVRSTPAAPIKFVECAGALPSPAALQVIELCGLRGTGILCFDPSLLFHLLDLLLGGSPTEVVDATAILNRRGLTAVERRLFAHLVRVLGGDLTRAWDGVAPLSIRPIRAETDPKHVALFEPGEVVVDSVLEVEIAGCKGAIHLVLPQSSLRPIEKKLASGLLDTGGDESASWVRPLTGLMREVTVMTTAELGRTSVTLRELLGLEVGDVIRLDREPDNPITLFVEGAPKLTGIPTISHGNIAVEVCSKVAERRDNNRNKGVDHDRE